VQLASVDDGQVRGVDWALGSLSEVGRWVATAPSRGAVGGVVLDRSTRSFIELTELQLVRADRIVTYDAATRVYADHETSAEFQLPSTEPTFPQYERVAAAGGRVLARLGRDGDDQPARLLVWHQQNELSWDRTVGAGYLAAGVAVSPDATRVALVEATQANAMLVTLLDAIDGRELWRVPLDLRNMVSSGQVSIPIMFTPDGSRVFVAGDTSGSARGPDYRWRELNAATGATEGETAVDLLGPTTDKQVSSAGVSKGAFWSSAITRFSESHTTPTVTWSCDYSHVVQGRTKQAFHPERDAKIQRQVTGSDGLGCPTRAIRATATGGLLAVWVAESRVRVLTWPAPP